MIRVFKFGYQAVQRDGDAIFINSHSRMPAVGGRLLRGHGGRRGAGENRHVPFIGIHDPGILQRDQQRVEIILQCAHLSGGAGRRVGSRTAFPSGEVYDLGVFGEFQLPADHQRVAAVGAIVLRNMAHALSSSSGAARH